jgi:hypothetical protein
MTALLYINMLIVLVGMPIIGECETHISSTSTSINESVNTLSKEMDAASISTDTLLDIARKSIAGENPFYAANIFAIILSRT